MTTAPNVRGIPIQQKNSENSQYKQIRVAAYCRVSTELEEQQNSYQVQIAYYTDLIHKKKEWTQAGIFADEGITGTQTLKRTEFNRMIRQCKKKKIDLILCKSISHFARNTVDTLEYVRMLKSLGIGVLFEKENINTLTMTSEFMIAMYGSFAQRRANLFQRMFHLACRWPFGKDGCATSTNTGWAIGRDRTVSLKLCRRRRRRSEEFTACSSTAIP